MGLFHPQEEGFSYFSVLRWDRKCKTPRNISVEVPPPLSSSPTPFPHGWSFPVDFGKLIDWNTMCAFSFEFYVVIHDVVDNWAIANEATLILNKRGFEPMFELMRTQFTNAYMALISLPMGVPLYIALYAFRQCYHEAVSASSHF